MDYIEVPKVISIDACTICQLRCGDCKVQVSLAENKYCFGKGYLNIENFKKIIDSGPDIKEIHLDSTGELFLNPDLEKILKLAEYKNIRLHALSGANFNFVRQGVLKIMVSGTMHNLVCAIDGASQEVYEKYRKGGDINKVLENIDKVNRLKLALNSPRPVLTWQFIVFGHNEHELPRAREMALERGMDFFPKMAWDSSYSPIRDPEFVKRETGWESVSRDEYMLNTNKMYSRKMCYQLWRKPRISWDGKVLGCCGSSKLYFGGNVFEHGVLDALNHEKIVHARRMLMGEEKLRDDIPCARCGQYRALESSGNWLVPDEIMPPPEPRNEMYDSILNKVEHFAECIEQGNDTKAKSLMRLLFPDCRDLPEAIEKAAKVAAALNKQHLAVRFTKQLVREPACRVKPSV